MSLDNYVFNGQRWKWRRIDTSLEFGPVDNLVRVSPENQKEYEVFVSVPAEFVKYLYDVLKDKPALRPCTLYLDQEGKRWSFGYSLLTVQNEKVYCDLWPYTASSFPSWARR